MAQKSSTKPKTPSSQVFVAGKEPVLAKYTNLKFFGPAFLFTLAFLFVLHLSGILPFSVLLGLVLPGREGTGTLGKDIALTCPVPGDLCKTGEKIDFNGNPALAYNLPTSTLITSLAPIVDYKNFSTDPSQDGGYMGIWQTSVLGEDCYTFTYMIPLSSTYRKVNSLPSREGESIAGVGEGYVKDNFNFILQAQKREKDSADPESRECKLGNLQPSEFGVYQIFDAEVFRLQ